jgi:hypothetical protein
MEIFSYHEGLGKWIEIANVSTPLVLYRPLSPQSSSPTSFASSQDTCEEGPTRVYTWRDVIEEG